MIRKRSEQALHLDLAEAYLPWLLHLEGLLLVGRSHVVILALHLRLLAGLRRLRLRGLLVRLLLSLSWL